MDALMGTPTKPSFLVWDKVYQKLSDAEDMRWLLRTADLAVPKLESELVKHQSQRYVWGDRVSVKFVCERVVGLRLVPCLCTSRYTRRFQTYEGRRPGYSRARW